MTADKHTPFESRLEAMLGGIDKNVLEIKRVVGSLHDRFSELQKSTDAVYDAVSYETPRGADDSSAYDSEFLEDNE